MTHNMSVCAYVCDTCICIPFGHHYRNCGLATGLQPQRVLDSRNAIRMAQNASEGHQDHTRLQTLSQLEQPDIDVAVTLVQASRSRQSVPEGCKELKNIS